MMRRRLIVGDIHSCYGKLISALEKASFDPECDILYSVGDIADRGGEPIKTIEFLMDLRDFRPVLGNHDGWLETYLSTGKVDLTWISHNGGDVTIAAVEKMGKEWRERVKKWLYRFPVIRVEEDAIIVHGGIPSDYTEKELENIASRTRPHPLVKSFNYDDLLDFSETEDDDSEYLEEFIWDRDYLYNAMYASGVKSAFIRMRRKVKPIETKRTIWIGHTPLSDCRPIIDKRYHLAAIDTGSWFGKVTVVDMGSLEYWQA